MAPEVRVGVGVFVLHTSQEQSTNPRFLMGRRLNSHGAGTYALPGGHLEFGETPEDCAIREVLEETGLRVTRVKFLTATNDYMPAEGKHYITLFMVLEPHKCESWDWFNWEDLEFAVGKQNDLKDGDVLEKPLFLPLVNLLRQRPGALPIIA
ncbi:NUDIX domain protein, putative [Talaromyces stipitatus ATCC 10500]|uniref:NUDIX domain protein, putative n=1 Tax=Talaromyces stipitatus (strain ATCC 10500 / CBS 375.48 / QM 6759 / NRRL 1006) TaxID=441959 RepID=B8MHG2_TALSN|nr:NUDIX domain protein, putative [Talaromyces stipitatus ATCC 10500]EED17141.1 NUDIX domain protein, putative [Talaromyces stipitatus ATCC 10500]